MTRNCMPLLYSLIAALFSAAGFVNATDDYVVGLSPPDKTENAESLTSVALSSNGRRVAAAFGRCIGLLQEPRPGVMAIWDFNCRQRPTIIARHTDGVRAVEFSQDDKLSASAGCDGRITLWDVDAGREQTALFLSSGVPNDIAFSPNGRILAAAIGGGSEEGETIAAGIVLFDVVSAREVARLAGHDGGATSISFFADGKRLVSGGIDGSAILWDLTERKAIKTLGYSPRGADESAYVTAVTIYPDQRRLGIGRVRLIPGKSTGEFITWDPEADTQNVVLEGLNATAVQFALSPDGSHLVSATAQTISLWETTSGRLVTRTNGHRPVSFSRDGSHVAFGVRDARIRVVSVSRLLVQAENRD